MICMGGFELLVPYLDFRVDAHDSGSDTVSKKGSGYMKKFLFSFVLLVVGCTGTGVFGESSVWKVQKDKSVIYLGGTCHVLRDTDYPLPPEFDQAYKAADIIVFETDIGKLLDPATQQKMLTQARYADGSTLDQHLSVQTRSELSAYCESNNVSLNAFRQFKPVMLIMTMTVMELMRLGVTQQGPDLFFYRQASKDRKVTAGLETIDEQMDYLLSMADGNEDAFVIHSIRDMNSLNQQFDVLANAWRKGDAGKLSELMVAKLKTEMPMLYKKLITDRNVNWLPLIEAYLKTPQTEFIVVGVGHLVGPDGIIETLKKRGFKVDKL